MAGFQPLPDDQFVILNSKGAYRQAPLARLGDGLYAKVGGTYARLYSNKATSMAAFGIVRLEVDASLFEDTFARLYIARGDGRAPLKADTAMALIHHKD